MNASKDRPIIPTVAYNAVLKRHMLPAHATVNDQVSCFQCQRHQTLSGDKKRFEHLGVGPQCDPRPHEIAKFALKAAIESGTKIAITRQCERCELSYETFLPMIGRLSEVIPECQTVIDGHRRRTDLSYFPLGRADVVYVLEIQQTSKTEESCRQEPWCEILSQNIFDNAIHPNQQKPWRLTCVRTGHICHTCDQRTPLWPKWWQSVANNEREAASFSEVTNTCAALQKDLQAFMGLLISRFNKLDIAVNHLKLDVETIKIASTVPQKEMLTEASQNTSHSNTKNNQNIVINHYYGCEDPNTPKQS
jgi:hypothetical protein